MPGIGRGVGGSWCWETVLLSLGRVCCVGFAGGRVPVVVIVGWCSLVLSGEEPVVAWLLVWFAGSRTGGRPGAVGSCVVGVVGLWLAVPDAVWCLEFESWVVLSPVAVR